MAAACAICVHPVAGHTRLKPVASIEILEDPERLAFEDLTLRSPHDGRVLVDRFSGEIHHGRTLLIKGPDSAKVALLRHGRYRERR